MTEKACCFTGHRRLGAGAVLSLTDDLYAVLRELIDDGYTRFLCGGAIGFDMLAASVVLSLRTKLPHIRLEMILPCRDQDKNWHPAQKYEYARILEEADSLHYIADSYSSECMRKRNRYLVDHADLCIAYYNGYPGGTAYTVNYAYRTGVALRILTCEEERN